MVLDYIKNGDNPEDVAHQVNQVVQKIRKSWLYNAFISPVVKHATKCFLWIGKCAGKNRGKKFIDTVVTDMDERGLLQKDC